MNAFRFLKPIIVLVVSFSSWTSGFAATWLEVEIGIIGSSSNEILEGAVERVKKENLSGLLVILDTPGGALEATRSMVKTIMASEFPIIVWVGPSGARAGSAGAFITLAAHVAVMAEGTKWSRALLSSLTLWIKLCKLR